MSFKRSSTSLHFWWVIITFTCVLLLVRSSSVTAINSDGILLLSFKYSILSDPLSVLESWNYDDQTPCSWTGVTCTEIGNPGTPDMFRVTSLVLPESQLLGSIPPDLATITHLRHLDLSNNFFNGSLPWSLFNNSELQVLSLSNNVFSGVLPPMIGPLRNLQYLNLSNNALAGKVPENLTTLPNLTVVSLRSNYFSGNLPNAFEFVEILDLSSNLFNGSLPLEFGGGNLRYLNLSYNNVSGTIPPIFGSRIPGNATIDLSFNNLTGEIPESGPLIYQKTASFAGNLELCGRPLKNICSVPSTLSAATVSTPTNSPPAIAAIPKTIDSTTVPSSPGSTPSGTQNPGRGGLKPDAIAGIAVGDLAGIALLAMIILYVYQLKKKKSNSSELVNFKKREESGTTMEDPSASVDSRGLVAWSCLTRNVDEETSEATVSDGDDKKVVMHGYGENKGGSVLVMVDGETELELETLLKASAYVLGASGWSIVYKAVLEDGRTLAVRRIGEIGVGRLREFENQVRVIAKLRHPNLVRVRGFYWGADEKLVIYDYVSNGSLANASYKKVGSSPCHLPLEVRLKIAKGVARGLSYIHEKKHVHGNLRPSNILLSSNMEPIISDFGLDRLVWGDNSSKADGSTRHFGSKGSTASRDAGQELPAGGNPFATADSSVGVASPYHAPESLKNLKPNPKWDVYSFGIVLLELLTGKVYLDREAGQWSTGSVVDEKNRVLRLADVAIRAEVECKEDAMLACFKLGFSCASLVPQKRPSMKEALLVLEKIPSSSPSY